MSGLIVSDIVDPRSFFQGVHDAPSLQLEANIVHARTRPRASSLQDCIRKQGYDMAGLPASNPQRDNDEQVTQQYANEQGRLAEALSFTALEWQPGRTFTVAVVSRQIEVSDASPVSGHPDGELIWLDHAGEAEEKGWHGSPELIPPERFLFFPHMFGREDTPEDEQGYRIGVEHKHPGVNTYGRILRAGVLAERPGWVVQAVMYGLDRKWDYVLLIDVALDATAVKGPRAGFVKHFQTVFDAKAKFELMDIRDMKLGFGPPLTARAVALSDFISSGGEPGDIRREFSGHVKFPCGYCEQQDRCNLEGEGSVTLPVSPLMGG